MRFMFHINRFFHNITSWCTMLFFFFIRISNVDYRFSISKFCMEIVLFICSFIFVAKQFSEYICCYREGSKPSKKRKL